LKLHVEEWWKHSIERKVLSILEPTGLIPKTPHDMREIMKNTQEHFVNLELNSEIAVSSGVAATAMMSGGYSGIVNISPFACLIGRVIEGLFAPWARDRNYPTISVEVDGNQLPPNIVNKLNIFMVNVLRFGSDRELSSLIEPARNAADAGLRLEQPHDGVAASSACAHCSGRTDDDECLGSCGK
ncbi:MAG TPA: hypothetical protein PLZ86_10255, partial [bacterium]|nr:hypothetical protein [bacterium]